MSITHYDLFAGIGGFSLALEEVFNEAKINHIFCEWAEFPAAVLKKHWPNGIFYGDIADLIADTNGQRHKSSFTKSETERRFNLCSGAGGDKNQALTILTGGFPCQPFSHAGRRKGTADDRYQWPNMFRVIQNVKPDWVIAENVRGLVTWNEGMVLEQVCTDLESEGYEVQPFIIPACAVNAPHRRDRVWIIAHCANSRTQGLQKQEISPDDPTNTSSERLRGRSLRGRQDREWQMDEDERQRAEVRGQNQGRSRRDWNQDWRKVAQVLERQRAVPKNRLEEQARRTAWRITKDWVDAQVAIIETKMVTTTQVFLPYTVTSSGKSLYHRFLEDGHLMIGSGDVN